MGGARGGEGNVDFVDGDVLFRGGGYLDLYHGVNIMSELLHASGLLELAYLARLALALIHGACLDEP